MAYICKATGDIVLSREAMDELGMVDKSIDDASAMVKQLSVETAPASSGHLMEESGGEAVTGGQLTRDIVITHNDVFPKPKGEP